MLTRLGKRKQSLRNYSQWVSPSGLKHIINDNHFVEILKKQISFKKTNNSIIPNFYCQRGYDFEEMTFENLNKKYNCYKVAESNDCYQISNFNRTIYCMNNGYDIIYQATLQDENERLFGSADLLIRSDKINNIFGYNVIPEKYTTMKSRWGNYHYIVVDIKSSNISIKKNTNLLNNNSKLKFYKVQQYIYTKIVGNIQNYQSRFAFILAPKYTNNKKYMEFLGEIDYENADNYIINLTNESVNWKQQILPTYENIPKRPKVKEELINMKVSDDGYYNEKFNIAKDYGELTLIWNLKKELRNKCFNMGIYSYKDPRFNKKLLESFSKKELTNTEKLLLQIVNVENGNDNIYLKHFSKNKLKHILKNKRLFYLDFENFGMADNIIDINTYQAVIGVGYNINNQWKYKSFTLENPSYKSERKMFIQFNNFIKNICRGKEPLFVHWHQCEKYDYYKLEKKYGLTKYEDKHFFDLEKFFRENQIIVKGSFNFKLKNICKQMFEHGMINTTWNTNIKNGAQAMDFLYDIYKNNKSKELLQEVIDYNEIDCKVMYDIIKFLLKH